MLNLKLKNYALKKEQIIILILAKSFCLEFDKVLSKSSVLTTYF